VTYLYHPPPWTIGGIIPFPLLFLTTGTDVGNVSTTLRFLVNGSKVKGLVATQMLRRLFVGYKTFYNDCV